MSGGRIRQLNKPQIVAESTKSQEAKIRLEVAPSMLHNYPRKCLDFDFELHNSSDDFIRVIKERRTVYYPNATEIRRNFYYYTIYCVALNTCFATLFPLMALIYLNCMTLRALRILGRQTNSTKVYSQPLDVIIEEDISFEEPKVDTASVNLESTIGLNFEAKDTIVQTHDNFYHKKESRLTRISISIVWLFIVCHVWKLIPTIYELIYSEVTLTTQY